MTAVSFVRLDYSAIFAEPISGDRVQAIRADIMRLPGLHDVGLGGHALGLRFADRALRAQWSEDVSVHVDRLGVGVSVYSAERDERERLLFAITCVLNDHGIDTALVPL